MLYVYTMYISVCHIIIDVYHISDHMFFLIVCPLQNP